MTNAPHSLRKMLYAMVKLGGSDLFITAGKPPCFRSQSGEILPLANASLSPTHTEKLCADCMPQRNRIEFADTNETNFSLEYDRVGRFRVNVLKQKGTCSMVIRHIRAKIPTIEELGLPEIFKRIIMERHGLVIVSGPTGAGKSTSLAAMIDYRNEREKGHIITIEDPLEFVHEHKAGIVTQREVGSDTVDYKSALKNALRQNPDVILIGEIRDKETMEFAIEAAQTGHLCLATFHASNAYLAIDRILHMFPVEEKEMARSNISLHLKAIISQRLVKTVGNGKTAAIEILVNTPRISDLILAGELAEIREAMVKGSQYGMMTFDQHLVQLWKRGIITKETACENADSATEVRLAIQDQELKDESRKEGGDDGNERKDGVLDRFISTTLEIERA